MTLLEKARAVQPKGRPVRDDQQEAELAAAWLLEEISYTQAKEALAVSGGSDTYVRLAIGIRAAKRLGLIKVSR